MRLLLTGLLALSVAPAALAQTDLSGPISDGTTGPLLAGQVYHLVGTVTVPSGQTLTVQEGAIVKGLPNTHFLVYGTMNVNGAPGNPAIFTSIADDTAGGDTAGDGATAGAPGDWRGVLFTSTSTGCTMSFAEVRFGGQAGYAGVGFSAGGAWMDQVVVRDSLGHGVDLSANQVVLTSCDLIDNGMWPITNVPLQVVPQHTGNTASGNGTSNHAYVTNTSQTSDLSIAPDNCLGGVLLIKQSITVPSGLRLTFEEGLVVKASSQNHIVCYGQLFANGTPTSPVVLTSVLDDDHGGDALEDGPTQGTPGSWRGVFLTTNSDGSSLTHTRIRFAGQAGYHGLVLSGSSGTSLTDCVVESCATGGINFSSTPQSPTVTNCDVFDNVGLPFANVRVEDLPGFTGNQAWGNTSGDYLRTSAYDGSTVTVGPDNVPGGVLVVPMALTPGAGSTLTFLPGLVVKAAGVGVHVVVYGTLVAEGTASQPIVFTSIDDDDHGGDTLKDGATEGSPGDWRGLYLSAGADASSLAHVTVRYAGAAGYDGIEFSGADATLASCRVERCLTAGISFSAATTGATVTGCHIEECGGVAADNVPLYQLPGLSGNTAANNAGGDHTRVTNLSVSSPLTIVADNMIGDLLVFTSGMTIGAGTEFTIDEGMVVKMVPNTHLVVYGTLNLHGRRENPITLTSIYDDAVAGDTDQGGPPAQHGDWRGIFLASSSSCTLRDVRLAYAGAAGYAGVSIQSPNTLLAGVRVDHSAHAGFDLYDLGADTERLVAYDCLERGVELFSGSFELRQATSYGNGQEGIYAHPAFTGSVTDSISLANTLDNFAGFAPGEVRYSNGDPALAGSDGNIDEDPNFVNAATGNLTLFEESPCVDTADPTSPLDPDLTRADMGAFYFDHCRVRPYCSPKVNSLGCTPKIGSSGYPSVDGPDDLRITASDIVGQRSGFLLWSFDPNPLGAGVIAPSPRGLSLCLSRPTVFTPVASGGTEGQCDGTFDVPISHADMTTLGWFPGDTLHVQFVYEDPGHPDGTGWGQTRALLFQICP